MQAVELLAEITGVAAEESGSDVAVSNATDPESDSEFSESEVGLLNSAAATFASVCTRL